MRARLVGRRAVGRLRLGLEEHVALRHARRLAAGSFPPVCVCWDLDNTLVETGLLLGRGVALHEAVPIADPVANMLHFCDELTAALPFANRVFLSARRASLRASTLAWLNVNGVVVDDARVLLVPRVDRKLDVWRMLARRSALVIVDDLCFGHETASIREYVALSEAARSIAAAFVGSSEITALASGAISVETAVRQVVAQVEEETAAGSA